MPKKLIVTHQSPDLDAVGSVWLLRRFAPSEFGDAMIMFVPAGGTLPAPMASQFGVKQEDVVHVDTGGGEFDHHQAERAQRRVCASSLVYDWLCSFQSDKRENAPLRALVEYITSIDHFEEASWPNPSDSRYDLMVHSLLIGAKLGRNLRDEQLVEFGGQLLDAAYEVLRANTQADEIIQRTGQTFRAGAWKGIALASSHGEVEKRAQKLGFQLMVRKDERLGSVRIKALPETTVDLTATYERILQKDSVGTWFLHGSKRMLLNGSAKNSTQVPTPLSLVEVVQILKETL